MLRRPVSVLTILAAAICSLLVSGCGQKGPLYMPEKTSATLSGLTESSAIKILSSAEKQSTL
jgi:predicted small lipoprotein YifL